MSASWRLRLNNAKWLMVFWVTEALYWVVTAVTWLASIIVMLALWALLMLGFAFVLTLFLICAAGVSLWKLEEERRKQWAFYMRRK